MDKNRFVKTANVVSQMMEWYWEYGVDRKEYTIQPAGLYTLNEVWERQRAIGKACDGKPCVAFWGPSQSGKSSLLSYYIDGDDPDGADSALSWGSRNVRFSPDQDGRTKASTTVFNPQNGRNDASGLVTRFYRPADDRDIDEEFPISLIPASRKQVLHALAVGYRNECKNASKSISAVDVERKIVEKSGVGSVTLDREAFLFVSDLCDVCKMLSATETFFKTYGNEDFRSKVIQSKYASNINEAWDLAGSLLWDGNEVVTSLAKKIISFSKDKLGGCNEIMASAEAAAKLEDISSLSRATSEMSGLSLVNEGGQLKIGGNGTMLSSAEFGILQACIGEMRVPLKETKSDIFNAFLAKHDLLDIPGVTNHATGSDVGDSNLVDLTSGDPDLERRILVQVYKTGKTLSVVYGQAENCSVDSFVVFVPFRREGGLSRPKVIEEGIRAWLAPYMECGSDVFASRPPLNLYINLSLFGGQLAEELANQRNGLAELTDLRLAFADKKCADYFFTTNKFMPCNLSPQQQAKIEDDDDFARAYLSDECGGQSLKALFNDPKKLGTDFMFKVLNGVDSAKRLAKYEDISKYDITRVISAVADARPQDMGETERRQRDVLEYLLSRLEIASLPDQTREKEMAVSFIKCIFDVDYSLLDSIPTRPSRKSDDEIGHYINSQMQKWIANRTLAVSSTVAARRILNDPLADVQPLLEALTCHSDGIVEFFKVTFSFVVNSDIAREARGPFALMLSNVFATGDVGIARRADVQNAVPIEGIVSADLMIEWFANRVRNLLDHGLCPNQRPSLEGDLEIDELANQLS